MPLHDATKNSEGPSTMASAASSEGPPVTRDPRFKAGRTLIHSGRSNDGAVDIFATLLEVSLPFVSRVVWSVMRVLIYIFWTGNLE